MNSTKKLDEIDDPEELVKIGREFAGKEEYETAIKYIEKALSLKPDDLNALNSLGFANGRSGNFEEAIKCYKRAIEIEPQYQKALGNLAHVYQMQERFDEAIEFYEKSLNANPENEDLRFPPDIIKVVEDHLEKTKEQAGKK